MKHSSDEGERFSKLSLFILYTTDMFLYVFRHNKVPKSVHKALFYCVGSATGYKGCIRYNRDTIVSRGARFNI